MPTAVVSEQELYPHVPLNELRGVPQNQMFDLREALGRFQQRHPDAPLYDACQGDGGQSLPGVPGHILEAAYGLLREQGTGYDKPHGTSMFWRAVIEDYWGLNSGLGLGPKNVIACQGGRDALLKAYSAMLHLGDGWTGDYVVLSRVPWVSYNWGPYLSGANVLLAPGTEANAWALTPEAIRECAHYAEVQGRGLAGLVITSPDNPTGRVMSLEAQIELAHVALSAGVSFVLFDWIYHYVTDGEPYDVNKLLEAFTPAERKRLMVMDGLTKSLGASNIRNAHLLVSEEVVDFTKRRASHGVIPGFYGMAVAAVAYKMGYAKACETIVAPTSESRRRLGAFLQERGTRHIMDQGYYAFLDVGEWLDRTDFPTSAELGMWLAGEHGVAIVPGSFFSQFADRWVRFSYAQDPEVMMGVAQKLFEVLDSL